MIKYAVMLLISLFSAMEAMSQGTITLQKAPDNNRIEWSYEVKKLDRNEYELIFRADLQKGWHIFSQNPGDSALIGPSFSFDDNAAIRLLGEVREEGKLTETSFEGFDGKIRYFEGVVAFIQKIAFQGERTKITGEHRFQICNDNMCLPPATRKFEFITEK